MGTPIQADVVSPHHTYFDDSGCNAKASPNFIWAGYIAPLGFWQTFGTKWNRILDRRPRIEFWHQTDVRGKSRTTNSSNPFHTFDAKVLEARESALCELLHDNRKMMWAMAIHLRHANIEKYVKGKVDNPKWTDAHREIIRPRIMESPKLITLMYALRLCEHLHSKKPQDRMPVSFYCESERDHAFQPHMIRAWETIKRFHPTGREDLGVLNFVEGKSRIAPQLQAADMLAWQVNRRARRPRVEVDQNWKYMKGRRLIEDTIPVQKLKDHVKMWSSYVFR